MAQALGGVVAQSDKGRGIGIHDYTITEAGKILAAEDETLRLVAMHQDQVIQPPSQAVLLAQSTFCPYAALSYGKSGLSFQGHPEFTLDCARDMTRTWQEISPTPDVVVQQAEESFRTIHPNSDRIKSLLGRFLNRQFTFETQGKQ
jgi:GMP synthase-like glutamine amidotransferase